MGSQQRFQPIFFTRASVVLVGLLAACVLLSARAAADFVPTHGLGPHLDPFVGGPVAPGVVGPAAAGGAGEAVPAFSAGVAWATPLTAPAADAIADPVGIWHWESEIDVVGLVGPVPVSFNGAAPLLITFGPGSDLYYHANQADLAGSPPPFIVTGELGPVWKQLVNSTPFLVAWGTSVSEGAGTLGFREALALQTPPGTLPALASVTGNANVIELTYDVPSGTLSLTELVPAAPPPAVPALSLGGWAVLVSLITLMGCVRFSRTRARAA